MPIEPPLIPGNIHHICTLIEYIQTIETMRRFKKKLLGWITPKKTKRRVEFVQSTEITKGVLKLEMKGIRPDVEQISSNIYKLTWYE